MRHQLIRRRAVFFAPFAFFAALTAACGETPLTPAPSTFFSNVDACGVVVGLRAGGVSIVNGTSCNAQTSPVALLLLNDKSGKTYASCSGSVIGPTAVLTAAHCLADTTSLTINFGSKQIAAASFAFSPDYDASRTDSTDVGVVIAASPIGQPILSILTSRDPSAGETIVIAGFGQQEMPLTSGQTLKAGTTTVSQVGSLYFQTNAGLTGAGACPGDSGGPALVSVGGAWAVAGITATLAGPCVIGTNTFVNVRNASVRSFILSHVPDAGQR